MFTARATVGCRLLATDGRSYGGILAVVNAAGFVFASLFTARNVDGAFWSRSRSGRRDTGGRVAAAVVAVVGVVAVVVVVMRAVRLPVVVVLVVRIPADGFFLTACNGVAIPPDEPAGEEEEGRFGAAAP